MGRGVPIFSTAAVFLSWAVLTPSPPHILLDFCHCSSSGKGGSLSCLASGIVGLGMAQPTTVQTNTAPRGHSMGNSQQVPPSSFQNVAFSAMPGLELDLGAEYGLAGEDRGGIGQSTVMTVMRGAEKKNKESLYFLGLLRLYGAGGLPEDHEKGVAAVREAAELGHTEAQTAMGMLLLHGVGVERADEAAGAAWLRKAAKSNDKNALWMLGKLVFEVEDRRARSAGYTSQASYREASSLLHAAAEQDSKEAKYYLGLMHEYGKGVEQDFLKAYNHYRQSSNQGYMQALYNMALMVAYGRGVAQDYKEAYRMFQQGAARNHAPSMYFCGIFHLYGHGIDIDYTQALLWFDHAAQMKDPTISDEALLAKEELVASLNKAKKVNAEIMKGFETPLAEEPALFASQHHHGDDGGDDGFGHGDDLSDNFREFVAEAEAGLEAGIALARAERAERDEIRKDSLGDYSRLEVPDNEEEIASMIAEDLEREDLASRGDMVGENGEEFDDGDAFYLEEDFYSVEADGFSEYGEEFYDDPYDIYG